MRLAEEVALNFDSDLLKKVGNQANLKVVQQAPRDAFSRG